MVFQITEYQKRIIKELVDEIIVNRGVLNTAKQYRDIEGLKADDLYRQAFRYYKMIMKGESPLDIDHPEWHGNRPGEVKHAALPNTCIGCNQPLSEDDIRANMPVCPDCRAKVKVDYEILRDLFY